MKRISTDVESEGFERESGIVSSKNSLPRKVLRATTGAIKRVLPAAFIAGSAVSGAGCKFDSYCADGYYMTHEPGSGSESKKERNVDDGYRGTSAESPICPGALYVAYGGDIDSIIDDQQKKIIDNYIDGANKKMNEPTGNPDILPPLDDPAPLEYKAEDAKRHVAAFFNNKMAAFTDENIDFTGLWTADVLDKPSWNPDVFVKRAVFKLNRDLGAWRKALWMFPDVYMSMGEDGNEFFLRFYNERPFFKFEITESISDDLEINFYDDKHEELESVTVNLRENKEGSYMRFYSYLHDDNSYSSRVIEMAPELAVFQSDDWGKKLLEGSINENDVLVMTDVKTHRDVLSFFDLCKGNVKLKEEFLYNADSSSVDFSGIKSASDLFDFYSEMPRQSPEAFSGFLAAALPEWTPITTTSMDPDEVAENLREPYKIVSSGSGDMLDRLWVTWNWCKLSSLACDTSLIKRSFDDSTVYFLELTAPRRNGKYARIRIDKDSYVFGETFNDRPELCKDCTVLYAVPWSEITVKD